MKNWDIDEAASGTHWITFVNTENDLRLMVKWDGCTEVYGDSGGAHCCDLRQLANELNALWEIGARHFCDDDQPPTYGIGGYGDDLDLLPGAFAKTRKRIEDVVVFQEV